MKKEKMTIDEMKKIAAKRGGKCLSEVYKTNKNKLLWECKNGHKWEATPQSVKGTKRGMGTWCPKCKNNRYVYNIEDIKKKAKERGGECLSNDLGNCVSKIKFKCSNGHIWETTPLKFIRQGAWCPDCQKSLGGKPLDLKDFEKMAAKRGGKCLSKTYSNKEQLLEWQCANGHRFFATFIQVQNGRWCSCRKLDFDKLRDITKNSGKKIIITSSPEVSCECRKGHKWIASTVSEAKKCPYCKRPHCLSIEEMRVIAAKKGGKCLSEKYVNSQTPLLWQCEEGHIWKARPANVKRKSWCPKCSKKWYKKRRIPISDIEKIQILTNEKIQKVVNLD